MKDWRQSFSDGDLHTLTRLLHRCFYSFGATEQDAKDLAQRVWLKCNYDPARGVKPGTYLFKVAQTVWADHLRSAARRRGEVPLADDDAEGQRVDPADGSPSQEELFLAKEVLLNCASTPEEAEIARLMLLEEMSIRRMAKATNKSVSKVRTMVTRIRNKVRRDLGK